MNLLNKLEAWWIRGDLRFIDRKLIEAQMLLDTKGITLTDILATCHEIEDLKAWREDATDRLNQITQ